jgi:hypothetical protein
MSAMGLRAELEAFHCVAQNEEQPNSMLIYCYANNLQEK